MKYPKYINKQTLKRAQMLTQRTDVVARVYELNANGISAASIHKAINKEFAHAKDFIPITSTIVRKLLHKEKPCGHPSLFKLVQPEHEKAVQARFRGNYTPPPKRKAKKDVDIVKLLQEILEARKLYHLALKDAEDAGYPREKIKGLIDSLEALEN